MITRVITRKWEVWGRKCLYWLVLKGICKSEGVGKCHYHQARQARTILFIPLLVVVLLFFDFFFFGGILVPDHGLNLGLDNESVES